MLTSVWPERVLKTCHTLFLEIFLVLDWQQLLKLFDSTLETH